MIISAQRPPNGAGAAVDEEMISAASKSPLINSHARSHPQGKKRPADAIILASQCRMTGELLAESIELAIGYGTAILAAILEGDDESIISNFRGFDASARCARRCAEDLRSLHGEVQQ
jgi:hypothetical protein